MKSLVYFRSIFVGFFLAFLLFISAVFFQINVPTESSRWIYEIYQIKSNIADSISTPKLVIISGSNSLFSISCKTIKEEINIDCLNGGTHAGLQLDYILDSSKKWLNKNDIVILPFEYEMYQYEGKPSNLLIDYVLSRDSQYLLSVDFLTKLKFITGVSFDRLEKGILSKFNISTKSWDSFYKSENLNKYGDETSNKISNIKKKQKLAVAKLKPQKPFTYQENAYSRKVIKDFVDYARQNDIQVFATWPSTVWFDVYQDTRQDEFNSIREFYDSINVPVLGNPEDFMYDKSMFFDSIYHLNDLGVKETTQKLIKLLNPYLKIDNYPLIR